LRVALEIVINGSRQGKFFLNLKSAVRRFPVIVGSFAPASAMIAGQAAADGLQARHSAH
jgi:hypothetical protein